MNTGSSNRGRGTMFLSLLKLLDRRSLDELKNPKCYIGRFLRIEEYHEVLKIFFRERSFSDMLTLIDFIAAETIAKGESATNKRKIKELKIGYLEMVIKECYKIDKEVKENSSHYRRVIQRAVAMLDSIE